MLHGLRIPPLLHILAYCGGQIRSQVEQTPQGFIGSFTFTELPAGGCDQQVLSPVARQIDLTSETECAAVVALSVCMVEVGVPVPSGVMGVELLGALRQLEAALPVARKGQQLT